MPEEVVAAQEAQAQDPHHHLQEAAQEALQEALQVVSAIDRTEEATTTLE